MNSPATASPLREPFTSQPDDRSKLTPQSSDTAPAICRICRGEGTSAEPLFYPCKCSGSIKYVHQDCLMEWLSHSQKKYCELCKTSFRFTKLYAPDMPQSLPVHVFLEHLAKYLARSLWIWLRVLVTVSVWVLWLPYFMRVMWAFMFSISDDGLGAGQFMSRQSAKLTPVNGNLSDHDGTCPVRTVFEESIHLDDKVTFLNSTAYVASSPTLLSGVGFLNNLTRSPAVNRVVITIIEGQIITVLVIVCFILVILVRDYVVQQQPEINMRAAFADQEHNQPAPLLPNEEAVENDNDRESEALRSDDETFDIPHQTNDSADRPIEPLMDTVAPVPIYEDDAGPGSRSAESLVVSTTATDSRDSVAEEESVAGLDGRSGLMDYLRIYRKADGDIERIYQLAEEEGLEEKLEYWLNKTRRSLRERRHKSQEGPGADPHHPLHSLGAKASTVEPDELGAGSSTPSSEEQALLQQRSKGKERQWFTVSQDQPPNPTNVDADSLPGPSRPRAHSDGPEWHTSANPLGNNSWSFTNLPSTDELDDSVIKVESRNWSDPSSDLVGNDGSENRNILAESPGLSNHGHQHDASVENPINVGHDTPNERHVDVEVEWPGLVGRVTNYMWGDLDQYQEADDPPHAAVMGQDAGVDAGDLVAADDPWVDEPMGEAEAEAGNANGDANDVANVNAVDAAAAADMDAEAIEDLEDFEGVMELLGMRGPIIGLFQNAIFCAVLVSVTIFACIFIPYNIGRISLWIAANPIQLVRMAIGLSKVVQDAVMMIFGFGSWCALNICDMFTGLLGGAIRTWIVSARKASWSVWTVAGSRVVDYALMDFPMTASEMQNFSAISHEALNSVKHNIGWVIGKMDDGLTVALTMPDMTAFLDGRFLTLASSNLQALAASLGASLTFLMNPSSWVIELGETGSRIPVDLDLAHWSGMDRFWAISAGYMTIFAVGALYLKRGVPFSRGNLMHAWEAGVIETLHQASGIMKVILIISIEMLVFPLYCGLLLDGALLPLFENTTFKSRFIFTCKYPLTSIFVHWFVGTGYMFHFALFVSMCRKIMRPGVLYFIRDPDDPEFHPVRDVLERNLTTQLRKILFSAFVYGALVIVCLGGVVWGLYYAMPGVLPIHYSSNEPVLEFPVDLLFYNFLMPLAVKFFRPSDGLHAMYTWWFRKCARGLRLTYFLFGERRIDEEGTLQLKPELRVRVPAHRSFLLELDENNQVIPKTWKDTFDGGEAIPNPTISKAEMRDMRNKKARLVKTGQLNKSGHFVRAPASDRVKIPKGQKVFLTVSERGHRKDGNPEIDIYSTDQYQLVYIPPSFRARIFWFILLIWLFAAVTGVGFTIAPLVLGRAIFKTLIPAHIRTNDIYAFSIGVYVLGSLAYAMFRLRYLVAKSQDLTTKIRAEISSGRSNSRVMSSAMHGAKLAYAYFFLIIIFPLLVSTLMELYVSIPLHTYMNPPRLLPHGASTSSLEGDDGRHTIRVIQSWTLGLLYLNLVIKMITSLFPDTRAAVAVRSVMRRGYWKPDVYVLTRAFIVPGSALFVLAIFGPPSIASALMKMDALRSVLVGNGLQASVDAVRMSMVFRYSYPAAAVTALLLKYAIGLSKVFNRWTASVRDEAYLIGERLHNFGAATAGSRKAKRAWGAAGGGRL
ncbi:hypothetical protein E4U42_005174 [Claviceps africana]|uniref:RING-type E3 ubiquitin transferase n=1 Tax=Claviceps africana TaxID=83212 RepID=A0A8K0NFQ2_9HYPO|nr:hypothetical protein E4U42_005174 [Claviceps africana]